MAFHKGASFPEDGLRAPRNLSKVACSGGALRLTMCAATDKPPDGQGTAKPVSDCS